MGLPAPPQPGAIGWTILGDPAVVGAGVSWHVLGTGPRDERSP